MHNMLTSTYSPNQVCYSNVCAVRDEEAAGSNPATPTKKPQVTCYEVACCSCVLLSRCPILGAKTRIAELFGNLSRRGRADCAASPKLLGPVHTHSHHDLGKRRPGEGGVLAT